MCMHCIMHARAARSHPDAAVPCHRRQGKLHSGLGGGQNVLAALAQAMVVQEGIKLPTAGKTASSNDVGDLAERLDQAEEVSCNTCDMCRQPCHACTSDGMHPVCFCAGYSGCIPRVPLIRHGEPLRKPAHPYTNPHPYAPV